jgi:hypothetical protein
MTRNEDNEMIAGYEHTCEDYRNADFTKRLDMYMSLPTLRNDFLEIDRKEMKTGSFKTTATHIKDLV